MQIPVIHDRPVSHDTTVAVAIIVVLRGVVNPFYCISGTYLLTTKLIPALEKSSDPRVVC